ncbi:hypothetical protein [Massilia sp. SYSU DXS3249]
MLAQTLTTFDEQLDAACEAAIAPLRAALPDIDQRIDAFIACFGPPPAGATFKHLTSQARALHAAVAGAAGAEGASRFLLASLLAAVRASMASERLARLPARVRAHQLRQFARLALHDERFLPHCRLEADVFLKEFGLATLRLYAGASSVIDPYSGVGRSLMWKAGLARLPARALFFLRAGGFKPYFEVHVNKLYTDEFNEEGRNECYRCCAELYALHPDNLGMFAGSWFYDPAIARVSPRLAYLREVPVAGGARCMLDSHNDQAVANATATSATRRALVEAGRYRPASYALVWPRRAQIAWARRHPGKN